jgi:anti-sigma-K factor RskA
MIEKFKDYLHAYSLGCLDKDELKEVTDYIENGGEFNMQEFGEYQNLVSLLPAILAVETPDPQLKDNVARKLYRLKDEIKTQRNQKKISPQVQSLIKEDSEHIENEKTKGETSGEIHKVERRITKSGDVSHHYKTYNPEENEKDFEKSGTEGGRYIHTEEDKEVVPTDIAKHKPVRLVEDNVDNIIRESIAPLEQPIQPPVDKNYSMAIIGFLLFFIVVIGIIIVYVKISSDVKDYKNEVDKLNKEINSLTIKLSSNQEIDQMLQSPNVQIVNLKGTNLNLSGFGKLIISPERGFGYIQLAQMPALAENKAYQLWVSISGNFMSLGAFNSSDKMEYYSFKIPNLPPGYDINFLVTEEPTGGVKTPGRKVYLTGNL